MQTTRHHPLRKVAILVASLDHEAAEQILASLPPRDATAVRSVVDRLEEIDPEEQQAILGDFHRSAAETAKRISSENRSADGGVELDPSLIARIESGESDEAASRVTRRGNASNPLAETDADAIAESLGREHPQTIAVVLSRLDRERGAAVLANFSVERQAEILGRMAEIDFADPDTLRVVESQLAQRISRGRQQQQRMAAGIAVVEQILDATPHGQRKSILTSLSARNPSLATRLTEKPDKQQISASQTSRPIPRLRPFPRHDRDSFPLARRVAPIATVEPRPVEKPAPPTAPIIEGNPFEELKRADDATLLVALARSDQRTIMLALSGADESFLKRVLRGCSRKQAKAFRSQLRKLGPTRLSDLLAAQQQLVETIRMLSPR